MNTRRRLAAGLVIAALALATATGCASETDPSAHSSSAPASESPQSQPPVQGGTGAGTGDNSGLGTGAGTGDGALRIAVGPRYQGYAFAPETLALPDGENRSLFTVDDVSEDAVLALRPADEDQAQAQARSKEDQDKGLAPEVPDIAKTDSRTIRGISIVDLPAHSAQCRLDALALIKELTRDRQVVTLGQTFSGADDLWVLDPSTRQADVSLAAELVRNGFATVITDPAQRSENWRFLAALAQDPNTAPLCQ